MRSLLICLAFVLNFSGLALCQKKDYTLANKEFKVLHGDFGKTLVDFSNMGMHGRLSLINGNVTINEDMDDQQFSLGVEVFTSPAGDGKYKKIAMDVPPIHLCEGMEKFYKNFVQPTFTDDNSNFPRVGDDGLCPFPKGTYFFRDIVLDTTPWPQHMPEGILKGVVTFYKNTAKVGGFEVLFKIEPSDDD